MAGGKRLVGGSIPGTGLFVHEAKSRDRGPAPTYSANANKPLPMVEQEEQKVNGQLVNILERKCAKQRRVADEESQKRVAAEANLEVVTKELAEASRKLEDRERQVNDLCSAQKSLADDRKVAAQRESALVQVQSERDEALRALKKSEAEAKKLRESSGSSESEWKDQILRLVAEVQTSQRRADELSLELEAAKKENAELTHNAQDVVLRYEEESRRRLELESRCLDTEEKGRAKEQKVKTELDQAQGKAKQSCQARERTEEILKHREEKCQKAEQRAATAEAKCQSLEAEVQRLKTLLRSRADESEQRLSIPSSEAPKRQSAPGTASNQCGPAHPRAAAAGAASRANSAAAAAPSAPVPPAHRASSSTSPPVAAVPPGIQRMIQAPPDGPLIPAEPGVQRTLVAPSQSPASCTDGAQKVNLPPSRIPPPAPRSKSHGSRPGTAQSGVSIPSPMSERRVASPSPMNAVRSTHGTSSPAPASAPTAAARGSSSNVSRSAGEDTSGSQRMPPGAIRRAGSMPARRGVGSAVQGGYADRHGAAKPAAVADKASAPAQRCPSAGSCRPGSSRPSSDAGDRFIDDHIPSEPDSSDEELLTAM